MSAEVPQADSEEWQKEMEVTNPKQSAKAKLKGIHLTCYKSLKVLIF